MPSSYRSLGRRVSDEIRVAPIWEIRVAPIWTFWGRQCRASVALDEAAQNEATTVYPEQLPREGLVKHPRYWPGIHCYRRLPEGTKLHGIWINRTLRYQRPDLTEKDVTSQSEPKTVFLNALRASGTSI